MWTPMTRIPWLPTKIRCNHAGCDDMFEVYEQLENHWNARHIRDYYRIKRWAGADLWSFHDDGYDD